MHHVMFDKNFPPEGYKIVPGKCPNAGSACNCIGLCQPKLVKEDEMIDFEEYAVGRPGDAVLFDTLEEAEGYAEGAPVYKVVWEEVDATVQGK